MMRGFRPLALLAGLFTGLAACAQPFKYQPPVPTLDRWMYFIGDFDGQRPAASTFGAFDPRFDVRDAQFLLGWDTAGVVATNAGPSRYLLRRARITLTVTQGERFEYDPTHDAYTTYATNQPYFTPDLDPGRPVELYGAGFRNGFTAATFLENSPYGPVNPITSSNISLGTRNAFAVMFDTNGLPADVGNNVGQRNPDWTQPDFETTPWAIGQTTNVAPGELVPEDARFTFDVDLGDPLVVGYLQRALHEGRLRLVVSSLHPSAQVGGPVGGGGQGAFPLWATKENLLFDAPALELAGTLVSDADTDGDGLPDDWEYYYFDDLSAEPDADSDRDGATNRQEFLAGTDPRDPASRLFLSATQREGGVVRVEFPVAPSRTYALMQSTDLVTWQPVDAALTYPARGLGRFLAADALPGTVFLAVRAAPSP